MNRSDSSLKTSELLKKFYDTAPDTARHLLVHLQPQTVLSTEEATHIICATISDPRGVVNCTNVLMPRSDSLLPNLFVQLESTLGKKVKILCLINILVSIGVLNENGLKEEIQYQKTQCNFHDIPSGEEKEVASAQQRRFKYAAKYFLDESCYLQEEINPIQTFENYFGLLGRHPSVYFLVGLLCYKSGEINHLKYAYQLFEYAKQGILLGPTCVVLQSLIVFWATNCGQFDVHSQNDGKDTNSEEVKKIIINYVFEKLLQALAIANGATSKAASVETALIIDLHSAISCVYFCQKWNDESLDKSKFHFGVASGLFDNIKIPIESIHSTHSIFYVHSQNNPQILLLRAGRFLNLDVPKFIPWKQLDEMNILVDKSWEGIPNSPFRPAKKIAMFHALWPTILTEPLNAWDSSAPILVVKGGHGENFKIENVEDVKECWWYKAFSTASEPIVGLLKICEICGLDSTPKCKLCKKVFYCSKQCQTTDWHVSHNIICKKIR